MTEQNYDDLVAAIEHVSSGLERLAILALDLKRKLDEQHQGQEADLTLSAL